MLIWCLVGHRFIPYSSSHDTTTAQPETSQGSRHFHSELPNWLQQLAPGTQGRNYRPGFPRVARPEVHIPDATIWLDAGLPLNPFFLGPWRGKSHGCSVSRLGRRRVGLGEDHPLGHGSSQHSQSKTSNTGGSTSLGNIMMSDYLPPGFTDRRRIWQIVAELNPQELDGWEDKGVVLNAGVQREGD